MNKFLLAAALLVASAVPSAAITVTVANVGSLLNESIGLPTEDTPGGGAAFDQFFEFTLPTRETVTLSMTDSATGAEQITSGLLSLNHWTSTGPGPLFIPSGALIESATLLTFPGGQGGVVAPDPLTAGNYFAEVSGVSGTSALRIAVDSTVTGTAVPEASTWAMAAVGFAFMAWGAWTRKVSRRLVDSLT